MNKRSIQEINVIGIDVSKAKLDCAWLREENKVKTKVVTNNLDGWKELITWARTNTGSDIGELHFVMEATGIYHENLATSGYTIVEQESLSLIQHKSNTMPKA